MVDKEFREAAHAVAAHLCERAICVDVMHITCAFTARRRLHYDHAVASDAGMTIAECRNLGGGKLELFFHSVKEHEVVAEAMKFPERIGCHARSLSLMYRSAWGLSILSLRAEYFENV